MDKQIKTNRQITTAEAQNQQWQEHVFTSQGRQILAEVLNGELKQEIPSAYIGYFPDVESLNVMQFPQFISGVSVLPEKNKKIDILSKEVQQDRTVLTVQVSNIGLEDVLEYNAIIIMAYNKSRQIVPFTISLIKDKQILQTQEIPFQQLFEISMLISSEAEITIELQPIVDASRIAFDIKSTGLIAENVQDAIEEVVVRINQNTEEAAQLDSKIDTHIQESILTGVHDLQYDKLQNKFRYKEQDSWHDIDTGATVQAELNTHKTMTVTGADGIHGLKYIDNKLQVQKEGQWVNVYKDNYINSFDKVSSVKIIQGDGGLLVKWADPQNTSSKTWAGTKVIYKIGSYPLDTSDGVLLVDNKVRDKFKNDGIKLNGLSNGVDYYFKFFSYDDEGIYSSNVGQKIATPKKCKVVTVGINKNNTNPATCCSYYDDALGMIRGGQDWDDFFQHFPCTFRSGRVIKKLNKADRTKDEQGQSVDINESDDDVMIAFRCLAFKIWNTNDMLWVSMTDDLTKDGYKPLAHQKGEEIKDYFYLGAYKASLKDGELRSLAGQTPLSGLYFSRAREYSAARGDGYCQMAFYQLMYIQIMYILKYANLNSQDAIGKGIVNNTNTINTGGTETRPMDWGEQSGQQHMVLFGIEDLWGNLYDLLDGLVTDSDNNILTATNNYNDTGSGYINNGAATASRIENFISKVEGTTEKGFLITEASGSETTYFCDGGSIYPGHSPIFGGHYGAGSNAGIFSIKINVNPSTVSNQRGGRLMYL